MHTSASSRPNAVARPARVSDDADLPGRCADLAGRVDALEAALRTERAIVATLVRAVDAKYQTAVEHTTRVMDLAVALGHALDLAPEDLEALRAAALLHDIGTLVVPVTVLARPGPLTADEFAQVRLHPGVGADLLADLPGAAAMAAIVRAHHERWDGLGYPDGLSGADIPLGARILALADAFDSMTRRRPDREALSPEAAAAALGAEAGKAFDPSAVARFLDLLPALPHQAPRAAPGDRAARACSAIARSHRENVARDGLASALDASADLENAVEAIAATVGPLVPHEACALVLPDGDGGLTCRAAHGVDAAHIVGTSWPVDSPVTRRLAIERRPLRAVDAGDEMTAALPTECTLASALVVPLEAGPSFVGALAVFSTGREAFSADHGRVLGHVSASLATPVQHALLLERAREEALTDPLTGLPNTRFLSMHLTQELARAARQDSPLALLVVDVDDFKQVNDSEGHCIGDRTLVEVARRLAASVRPYDVCARYAGDEFIVMMPECGPDEAEQRRRELADAIGRVQVEAAPGRWITVRASVGAAVFPDDGDSYESLLQAADRRMYADKTQARAEAPRLPPLPEMRNALPLEAVIDRWLKQTRA